MERSRRGAEWNRWCASCLFFLSFFFFPTGFGFGLVTGFGLISLNVLVILNYIFLLLLLLLLLVLLLLLLFTATTTVHVHFLLFCFLLDFKIPNYPSFICLFVCLSLSTSTHLTHWIPLSSGFFLLTYFLIFSSIYSRLSLAIFLSFFPLLFSLSFFFFLFSFGWWGVGSGASIHTGLGGRGLGVVGLGGWFDLVWYELGLILFRSVYSLA